MKEAALQGKGFQELRKGTVSLSICFKCRVSDSRKFGHSWTIEKLTVRSHTDSFLKNILPQVPQSMICIYIDVSVMVVMSVMLCSLCLFLSFSVQEWHTKLTKPIKLHQVGKCCLTSATFFVVKILRFASCAQKRCKRFLKSKWKKHKETNCNERKTHCFWKRAKLTNQASMSEYQGKSLVQLIEKRHLFAASKRKWFSWY